MKNKSILSAFIGMLLFAGIAIGQPGGGEPVDHTIPVYIHVIRVKSSASSPAQDTVVYGYTGLESRNPQLFEAVIRASTPEDCLRARDFSTAVPVGPEIASLTFDRQTGINTLRWTLAMKGSAVCRVLLVKTGTESDDYNIWRGQFGTIDPVTGTPQTIEFTTKKAMPSETR